MGTSVESVAAFMAEGPSRNTRNRGYHRSWMECNHKNKLKDRKTTQNVEKTGQKTAYNIPHSLTKETNKIMNTDSAHNEVTALMFFSFKRRWHRR
jgi:hypothetical protein